ncbi:DNA polymerase III subunit alpha [Candidatus Methylacidithermus pantelleriae]|uniref:Error-prone DNA polymerase n=1 Tax=Candidatus Methylacidithermus pantelleriae TaxID=2744239 RepID=A0A8J2FTI7_9BACT|nr:error-prone DNA polymerase [Candidatus Methylacidithermus pantelleriae]CAF0704988.1 Error-prone DNA polymerase [Candidatus Methylacidithermus pantelleriae]
MAYAELHLRSAFSFLRGASLPEKLVEEAVRKELSILVLCDRDGVYGIPRFHGAAKKAGIQARVGCELTLEDETVLPILIENRKGYENLCRLLTQAKLQAPKGKARIRWQELAVYAEGWIALTGDEEGPLRKALRRGGKEEGKKVLRRLLSIFGKNHLYVELQRQRIREERYWDSLSQELAAQEGIPYVATGGVLYATAEERPIYDLFLCLQRGCRLEEAGKLLSPNAERRLKGEREMRELFRDIPQAVAIAGELAERLSFSLENLGYQFPSYPVPPGETQDSFLEKLVWFGAKQRYGELTPEVRAQLRHELDVIHKLGFAGYFLLVWDIVSWCASQGILCQGRGSAANSAVCYSLGITAIDPVSCRLLFERFLSEGREGWPDIDIDLPSGEARERVIQEIYHRYGRRGAAMTACVITFQERNSAREIGKVLGLPEEAIEQLADWLRLESPSSLVCSEKILRMVGLDPTHPRIITFWKLYQKILGLPRHLGQHPGGIVIDPQGLDRFVPIERAAMPGRTILQWDKDDCEELGIVKVDFLGLGMMAVLQEVIQRVRQKGVPIDLAHIPKNDPKTFELLQKADTIGVFQVESRAQQCTLPRLRPENFYDLVIEIAIVRPGPLHGNLIHPYLLRRAGKEPVRYWDPRLQPVLERTLGIPLFQEQVLQIAMILGGFSASEAEELRRALGFHRSPERMAQVLQKLRKAFETRGVSPQVIEEIVSAISSFALYGFPESHAASFAILSYASAYFKAHHPAEFYAALLNHQPMGFYSPATLIQDGKRHGVRFLPVSVLHSEEFCTVENGAVRLGLIYVRHLSEHHRKALLRARAEKPFESLEDLRKRVPLDQDEWQALAALGALEGLTSHRREALWQVTVPMSSQDLDWEDSLSPLCPLSPMTREERVWTDFWASSCTVGPHPLACLRKKLPPDLLTAKDLIFCKDSQKIRFAGAVIARQRPATAQGIVFLSLEDETGIGNVVVFPPVFRRFQLTIAREAYLVVEGKIQRKDGVTHVIAHRVQPLSSLLLPRIRSHDFH